MAYWNINYRYYFAVRQGLNHEIRIMGNGDISIEHQVSWIIALAIAK